MIRLNDTIRLTAAERRLLETFAMEPATPETIDDYLAWLDHAHDNVWHGDTPEERLVRALIEDARKQADKA